MRASTLASVLVCAGAIILLIGIILKGAYLPLIGLLLIVAGGAKVNAEKKQAKQDEEQKRLDAAAKAPEKKDEP